MSYWNEFVTHWPSSVDVDEQSLNKTGRRTYGMPETSGRGAHIAPVPAIERAIAILRFLENTNDPHSCTVSGIARALELNKSTCSNILRTLESNGFTEYDPTTKAYRLGSGLIGLSIKARNRTFPSIAVPHMQALVDKVGFTCVAFEQLPNGEFVIVNKVENRKDIKVTIDIGQRFPPSAPVFARIALAWANAAAVDAFLKGGYFRSFTKLSKTDPDALKTELVQVRRDGYTISVGEYYLANTAIAAPVFTPQRDICRGICTVEFTSEVSQDIIRTYAESVRDTGLEIGKAISRAPS